VNRNETVSVSIIIRSTKFAVISSTWYLSCDSSTSTDSIVSDSRPAISGRRSSVSQKKFSSPQVNKNAAMFGSVYSLQAMMPSAAICGSATSAIRTKPCRPKKSAARR